MRHTWRSRPKTKEPLRSRGLAAGIGTANRDELCLYERAGPPVTWTVDDRQGGWSVTTYWPATGGWSGFGKLNEHAGTGHRFRTLFIRLADLLDRKAPSPSVSYARTDAGH